MKKTKVTTPVGSTVEWEGDLLPNTFVTLNGELVVPLGSLISHTHGEALEWLGEYLLENPEGSVPELD